MSLPVKNGFTLVELIIVIVIMGIVSAVSAPKFFNMTIFEERGYYDEVISAIRYAHKTAIASGCNYKVSVNAAGYDITRHSNCSSGTFNAITNPATGSIGGYTEIKPANINVTGSFNFYYDNNGQPNDLSGNPMATSSISIASRNITIESYTGFAHK
ncbi:MAG: prepilin-type N-terminal cleavage/methylation domain-containing protein [Gammaproteobacteria bacterium]|nr:prepilin-type N-terminal cleavage/methylation domain-containing protein [Gammaproteobacteria bacterium]